MQKKIPFIINFAAVLVISAFIASDVYSQDTAPTAPKTAYEWQKGMCYVTWSRDRYSTVPSDESLKAMAATGTKWVSILTTWYQQQCFTTKIFPVETSPSDESVIHAIQTAHSLGMKVMIKPHLDLVDTSSGSWRGEIACINEPDWQVWFESYRDFVLHYAKMSQEQNVDLFCIGTELSYVSTIRREMWENIVIKPVREVYKGPITYAANWDVEYMHVAFWDLLDYVGIDAYFPLSDEQTPNLEDIKKGWDKWVKEMEAFQKKVDKPIIFPEVGYCSADGCAIMPWEQQAGMKVNLRLQADCYEALLQTFWDKEWFYGVYWWLWGTDIRFGGHNNRGFTPQNKLAQKVVESWYSKPTPKRTMY